MQMNQPVTREGTARSLRLLATHLGVGLAVVATVAAMPPEQIYERVLPSVATLSVETRSGRREVGTAFVVQESGVAATAWHLVRDAVRVTARFADQQVVEVTGVVDFDELSDLALVRLKRTNRNPCRIAEAAPRIGAWVCVVGAPKGIEFSIADGLVSQMPILEGHRQYAITCPISPGNSGGPVVNADAEVIGLVSWSRKDAQNQNFATPILALRDLDPNGVETPWRTLNRGRKPRTARATSDPKPGLDGSTWIARGADDFHRTLRRLEDRPVTVVVIDGQREHTFQFTAPGLPRSDAVTLDPSSPPSPLGSLQP